MCFSIPLESAVTNATSEEKGKIVAAKKAVTARASSEMRYSQ
ncbi:hypothetical protein N9A28_07140 [Sulfurimonas sp.]|nr:hypothetical protein [Sulfurimonas sp.]